MRLRLSVALLLASMPATLAAEHPSFLQAGDAFCTNEDDFNGFVARSPVRPNPVTETCRIIATPTRVAVLSGHGGIKSIVRIMSGTNAYEIGWTNGRLPSH